MGFESSQAFFKLSMAGIFHDIGKKEIDREILEKPRPLLTQKERGQIETHATRSKEILSAVKGIPADVIQMVYEHHEDQLGQGYPQSLPKNKAHPLSSILFVANVFAEQAIKGPNQEGMSGKKAIEHIETMYKNRMEPKALLALKSLFI
jgi:HD-GYP domain-containing protein (c-di-GMP phosphodiesterase class II)